MSPNSAVLLLNERVQLIAKTNRDVADWLQERRRVEEAYVKGLRSLSRKEPPDATGDELGFVLAAPSSACLEANTHPQHLPTSMAAHRWRRCFACRLSLNLRQAPRNRC